MTRLAPFASSLLLLASAAPAQPPRVPVPISDREPMACSGARMLDLRRVDHPERPRAILVVRTAPSPRAAELARLEEGTGVHACLERRGWFGIVFTVPGQNVDCGVSRRWPQSGPYRGPCRSGWVHTDHIGEYADWISP